MPVFRCEGGPLDGKNVRKEDICWRLASTEPVPIEEYQERVRKSPLGVSQAAVQVVYDFYEYESRGPKMGVWKYKGRIK